MPALSLETATDDPDEFGAFAASGMPLSRRMRWHCEPDIGKQQQLLDRHRSRETIKKLRFRDYDEFAIEFAGKGWEIAGSQ
jgi:hypothetical protein